MPDDFAENLIAEEKFEEAAARLESVLEKEDVPGLRMRLATCHFRLGKFGDALANARRVASVESEHRHDAVLLVSWCLRNLRRHREASKSYMEFAENFPDSDQVRMAKFSAALCLEELDDWPGAIEIYRSIADDEAEFRLAICLERNGKPDEAAEVFEGFVAKYGDSPELLKVRFRLGSMRLRQNRIDEAIRHLEDAVRLGEGTFIGELAKTLIERARAKSVEIARKLRSYNA